MKGERTMTGKYDTLTYKNILQFIRDRSSLSAILHWLTERTEGIVPYGCEEEIRGPLSTWCGLRYQDGGRNTGRNQSTVTHRGTTTDLTAGGINRRYRWSRYSKLRTFRDVIDNRSLSVKILRQQGCGVSFYVTHGRNDQGNSLNRFSFFDRL